ncbi:2-phosphosulfolactate phosphatase family protein [soil metagenome]
MRSIDVCLSPELLHLYDIKGKIVVVIDILRATSCMTTALAHGIRSIKPVASLEECKTLKELGLICAAERDGKKAEGFDIGNSPFSYMDPSLRGKEVAMTTTNGTLAISLSKSAKQVIIGSFLNLEALSEYLRKQEADVLLLCSGWKGKVNLEDTVFAGAVVENLKEYFDPFCDAPLAAQHLFNMAKNDLETFLQNSSHVKRLKKLNIEEDISFCLTSNKYHIIPVLEGDYLVEMDYSKVPIL